MDNYESVMLLSGNYGIVAKSTDGGATYSAGTISEAHRFCLTWIMYQEQIRFGVWADITPQETGPGRFFIRRIWAAPGHSTLKIQ